VGKIDFATIRSLVPPPSGGIFARTFTVIDGTVCPLERPKNRDISELYYSGKHKQHVMKYIVCVSITSGLICYVSEAFPGSFHDKKCLDMCGISMQLTHGAPECSSNHATLPPRHSEMHTAGEWFLGDLGFVGCDDVLTGIKRLPGQSSLEAHESAFNDAIGHVRSLVEHQFARFKKFKCLSTAWRHELWQHHRAFRAVAQLVQLDLLLEAEFKPHPAVVRTDTDSDSEVDEDMEVDHEKQ
jgi:hypothetical protein